jgi:hypothetical protein
MGEITLPIVLQLLQTAGILVGIFYYIMTIRTNQRNQEIALKNQELTLKAQEQALESRQAQLLSSFMAMWLTSDSLHNAIGYWFNQPKMEYEEFKERYPRDSDGFKDIMRFFDFYEFIGLLTKWRLVDKELVDDMFTLQWDKYGPIIKGMQEDIGSTRLYEHYEWLAKARLSVRNAQES